MRRAGLILLAVIAAFAGCGGEEEPRRPPSEPAFVELEDRLGFDSAGILARQNRVETLIGRCMRENGFEYVPVDPFAQPTLATRAARLNDRDFARQFGYGISTLWGRAEPPREDANERIRAALGAADRRAYDRTLWGEYPRATFVEAVDRGDLTRLGGCTRTAARQAFGDGQAIAQIVARFDAHDDRVTADPRMVRADDRWQECMAASGLPVESSEDLEDAFTARMEAIVGPLSGPFATGPGPGERARPYDRAALADLQRDELAAARRDIECEERHVVPVETTVRREYEARFRNENKDLIAEVRATWK